MTAGPDVPVIASAAVRQALVPMAAFYLILMAALGLGLLGLYRHGAGPADGTGGPPGGLATAPAAPRRWPALIRHVLGTAIGGYLLLVAVGFAYYYGIAQVGGAFLYSVITGPMLLIALAMPVFAAASWVSERWVSERTSGMRGKLPGSGSQPGGGCREPPE